MPLCTWIAWVAWVQPLLESLLPTCCSYWQQQKWEQVRHPPRRWQSNEICPQQIRMNLDKHRMEPVKRGFVPHQSCLGLFILVQLAFVARRNGTSRSGRQRRQSRQLQLRAECAPRIGSLCRLHERSMIGRFNAHLHQMGVQEGEKRWRSSGREMAQCHWHGYVGHGGRNGGRRERWKQSQLDRSRSGRRQLHNRARAVGLATREAYLWAMCGNGRGDQCRRFTCRLHFAHWFALCAFEIGHFQ